jgi:hypothetical protein
VQGSEVQGSGFRVQGSGFKGSGVQYNHWTALGIRAWEKIISFLRPYPKSGLLGQDSMLKKLAFLWGPRNLDDFFVLNPER